MRRCVRVWRTWRNEGKETAMECQVRGEDAAVLMDYCAGKLTRGMQPLWMSISRSVGNAGDGWSPSGQCGRRWTGGWRRRSRPVSTAGSMRGRPGGEAGVVAAASAARPFAGRDFRTGVWAAADAVAQTGDSAAAGACGHTDPDRLEQALDDAEMLRQLSVL